VRQPQVRRAKGCFAGVAHLEALGVLILRRRARCRKNLSCLAADKVEIRHGWVDAAKQGHAGVLADLEKVLGGSSPTCNLAGYTALEALDLTRAPARGFPRWPPGAQAPIRGRID
jgi:hypothetical protein